MNILNKRKTNFLILFSAEKQRAIRPERKNIMRINLLSNPKTKYLENKTLYITRAVITKTEPGPIPFSLVITLDVPRYGLISDSLCLSTDRDWRVFREILQQTGLTRVHKEGKDCTIIDTDDLIGKSVIISIYKARTPEMVIEYRDEEGYL